MRLCFCSFIAVAPLVARSSPLSIATQAILSFGNEEHAGEQPTSGVGFDLTASYGTAVVSFANGTVVPVAIVTAEDGYTEVLKRLSLESSQHLAPPYQNPGDAWKDKPREVMRKARKAVGMPASQDVGYLAKVLLGLRAQVEEYLGQPITSAVVTTPDLIALYQEDLQDAFEYAGLHYIVVPVRYDLLYETAAAYAGYGFGLCSNYTEQDLCKEQQQDMPSEDVMAVLYTRTALTVSLSVVKSAYYLYEPINRYLSNFSLGHDALPRTEYEEYWAAVAEFLERIMKENPYYKRPTKVLLMGDESINDQTFVSTLANVLGQQGAESPKVLWEDFTFVAAKGAAELAKRAPYDPYKTRTQC